MYLTKYTDISLRVLMHLALRPNELTTIADIAERYSMSRNHLVKVAHQLALQGYLNSAKGRGGGISLACDPEQTSVGELVRAMEKTLDVVDCAAANCPLVGNCILKGALDKAMEAFLAVLDGYTIADLIRNKGQLLRLIG